MDKCDKRAMVLSLSMNRIINFAYCTLILLITGLGVTSLGHFDGNNTDKGLQMMIASVNHLAKSVCKSGR